MIELVELIGLPVLLVILNFILLVLFFNTLIKVKTIQKNFRELVRALAKSNYLRICPRQDVEKEKKKLIQIVIPAYNEEETIADVLKRIPSELSGYKIEPLIVVDGSTDNTDKIVEKMGYRYVKHVINLGQGDALRTGFEIALKNGADIIVTMDADGQHLPEELERVIKPIINGEADFVIGSRFLGKFEKESNIRYIGIKFFTWLINLLTGIKITDCTSGYRAFSAEALKKLELREDRFNAPELIIDAAKKGLRIKEVPVTIVRRKGGQTKKPRLGYAWGLCKTVIKTWLRRSR